MRKAGAAALIAGLLGIGVYVALRPGAPVDVVIPPGLSASQTAGLLRDKGVAPSALLVRLAAKYAGLDRKLKPGSYRFRRNMPLVSLLALLSAGPNNGVKVVIPEGFSARQIAERLEAEGVCKVGDFMREVGARRLEGYLFPTTYFFEPSTSVRRVAARMSQEFKKRIEAEYEAASPKPALTLHQLLTLASIVQREAVLDQEKPMIAAVYFNRMRLRMRLDADPTVQYALGYWKKGLTMADLHTPSSYNTYLHYGLPPGPICNPGLGSFQAALRPARTDAVYFVADNTGGHVFSSTHEQHLQAKKEYRRGLRAIKRRLKLDQH